MTDNTDYKGFRIKEIHAIVAIDGNDEECIPAVMDADRTMTPLIASDRVRLEQITKIAQAIATQTGEKGFKIVRFTVREDIGEIKP